MKNFTKEQELAQVNKILATIQYCGQGPEARAQLADLGWDLKFQLIDHINVNSSGLSRFVNHYDGWPQKVIRYDGGVVMVVAHPL